MWVKICGTTTAEDARGAVAAGADGVGFVFAAESRRRVTAAAVRAMGLEGLGVETVGVFTTGDEGEIAGVVAEAGLRAVQLHGAVVDEALVGRVRAKVGDGVGVVPVVHWEIGDGAAGARVAEGLRRLRGAGVARVLLDTRMGDRLGGTGVSFDWARAAEALAQAREGMELVLAGGLRPETVGEAVRVLRPWGVDVVSGVEREVGRKDGERVRAFVRAARGVGDEPPQG